MGDDDRICHQMLKTSLVCAPSWTSGIGAGDDSDTDDSRLDPSSTTTTTSQDSFEETASNPLNNNQDSATATTPTPTPTPPKDSDLLSILVPTVYLTRKDPSHLSSYHIYQIDIESSSGVRWSIYRRYSQFYALHQKLKAQDPSIGRLSFPPKRRINSKTSTIVQDRRVRLENYMQSLCRHIEKSRPSVDRDINLFYKFLSYSTKLSETLDQLEANPPSTSTS